MRTQVRRIDAVGLSFGAAGRAELEGIIGRIAEVVIEVLNEYVPDQAQRNEAREKMASRLRRLCDQLGPDASVPSRANASKFFAVPREQGITAY